MLNLFSTQHPYRSWRKEGKMEGRNERRKIIRLQSSLLTTLKWLSLAINMYSKHFTIVYRVLLSLAPSYIFYLMAYHTLFIPQLFSPTSCSSNIPICLGFDICLAILFFWNVPLHSLKWLSSFCHRISDLNVSTQTESYLDYPMKSCLS